MAENTEGITFHRSYCTPSPAPLSRTMSLDPPRRCLLMLLMALNLTQGESCREQGPEWRKGLSSCWGCLRS